MRLVLAAAAQCSPPLRPPTVPCAIEEVPTMPLSRRTFVAGDEVYGGRESGRRDDDWYRRERPPHHE